MVMIGMAATAIGGTQVGQENWPACSRYWSGLELILIDAGSVFHVPLIASPPAAAEAVAFPEVLAASFWVVACLHPDSASNDAAAIAAVIVLCIEEFPLLATARHDRRGWWPGGSATHHATSSRRCRQERELITGDGDWQVIS